MFMMRATNLAGDLVSLCLTLGIVCACTTTDVANGVKADKTPAPKAAKSEMDIAPLNETDTVTALLQPAAKLKPDTLEAAQHDVKASKIPYIGAWAADDVGCGKIDQDVNDGFAVITQKSIRQAEGTCTINAVATEDNPASINASCAAKGVTAQRNITLLVTAIGGLQIVNKKGGTPVEYVRCQLPKQTPAK
jgi:hypothetical protein